MWKNQKCNIKIEFGDNYKWSKRPIEIQKKRMNKYIGVQLNKIK